MTPSRRWRGAGSTRWAPAPALSRLRCAARGHRWLSQPCARGSVLVLCAGCGELLAVRFVDVDSVLGLPDPTGVQTALGPADAAGQAVDLVAALLAADSPAWQRLRAQACARPGCSIDALAQLAAACARLAGGDDDRALLHLHVLGVGVAVAAAVSDSADGPDR